MSGILFESAARPLLLAHAVVGFTVVGASTHHAVYALLVARGRSLERQLRRFGWIGPLALCAQLALGFALYPTYRVRVRAAWFDKSAPAVAQLFDFKEHLAALSLGVILAAALAGRALESRAGAPRGAPGAGKAPPLERAKGSAAPLDAAPAAAVLPGNAAPAPAPLERAPAALRWSVAALSCTGALFVWTVALIGLYVTSRHPVGLP